MILRRHRESLALLAADDPANFPQRYQRLSALMAAQAAALPFDEEWYLRAYPDVAVLLEAGAFENAQAHFLQAGWPAGRLPMPIPVDEPWYAAAHPARGGLAPAAHFRATGFFEGLAPGPRHAVDAPWYLARYPAARGGVETGHFASAQDYYNRLGYGLGHMAHAASWI